MWIQRASTLTLRMQTLTVLNPMARIDQHIMDDADLAGPFLFCTLFGTFLLLVRLAPFVLTTLRRTTHSLAHPHISFRSLQTQVPRIRLPHATESHLSFVSYLL